MPDVSSLPVAFLTEIQQDQVYGTILKELKKKMPDPKAFNAVAAVEQQRPVDEHLRSFSPHLLALPDSTDADQELDGDDDDSSVADDESPAQDGYDTDIEAGQLSAFTDNRPPAHPSFRGGHKKRSR